MATYLSVFAVVFVGFALAIELGIQVESAGAGAGVLGAAYVATKLSQPLRIAATIVLTPLVANVVGGFRKPRTEVQEQPESVPANPRPPSL